MSDQRETIAAKLSELGITTESVFIPWTKSRNFDPKKHIGKDYLGHDFTKVQNASLNWKVTVKIKDREVLTTDYSAGLAHCPSYDYKARWTIDYFDAIKREVETGRDAKNKRITPNSVDVVHSLLMDYDVLDCASFEEWANEWGYDTDSRSAESIYKACLEIALKLRNGLGETVIAALRDVYGGY